MKNTQIADIRSALLAAVDGLRDAAEPEQPQPAILREVPPGDPRCSSFEATSTCSTLDEGERRLFIRSNELDAADAETWRVEWEGAKTARGRATRARRPGCRTVGIGKSTYRVSQDKEEETELIVLAILLEGSFCPQ